jgi:hypothetical protein
MSATISPCGRYRYTLHRRLGNPIPSIKASVIMVNPSTADGVENDATIRKLIGFGERLCWSEFTVVNKFAWRATDVNELRTAVDPIGPLNDGYIAAAMMQTDITVLAWGRLKKLPIPLWLRYRDILRMAKALNRPLYCWGTCDDGHPRHPVMLAYETPLEIWEPVHAV